MTNSEFPFASILLPFQFPETYPTSKKYPTFPPIAAITPLTTYPPLLILAINLHQYHHHCIPTSTTWKNCHRFRSQLYLPYLRASRGDPCKDQS